MLDYSKEMLRLHKQGPSGMEVYNISIQNGMIVLESGPMGRPGHKMNRPLSDKPQVDRLVQSLIEKGYAPLEKTFGPWAAAKGADAWRNQLHSAQARKKKGFQMGGGF